MRRREFVLLLEKLWLLLQEIIKRSLLSAGMGQLARCFIAHWPDCRFRAPMISPRKVIIGLIMLRQSRCCTLGEVLTNIADRDYSLASPFMVL